VSKSKRGFASMDPKKVSEIASKGGKEAHRLGRGYEFDHDSAKAAGRKGGLAVSKDAKHMAEIGRKGGRSKARKAAE
jgi:general stress protein YciG